MSRKSREEWEGWLAADPAMREAWDDFRLVLARTVSRLDNNPASGLDALRTAADRVLSEAGEGKTHH